MSALWPRRLLPTAEEAYDACLSRPLEAMEENGSAISGGLWDQDADCYAERERLGECRGLTSLAWWITAFLMSLTFWVGVLVNLRLVR